MIHVACKQCGKSAHIYEGANGHDAVDAAGCRCKEIAPIRPISYTIVGDSVPVSFGV